jgi:hypothetical protein
MRGPTVGAERLASNKRLEKDVATNRGAFQP